ncbi:MAG: class I SAM-dependent methyltransferase [Pseudomonadota bacterium]
MTVSQADPHNASQTEYWNASAGLTWARHHDALDRQIAPLGQAAIRRLAPASGERVLDVGCGCGHTTLELAARIGPSGVVVGIDISVPMLEVARSRPSGANSARVEFLELDAQIGDLGHASFDAIYSRFGVMFFSDPVAAFTRLHAALKPGGRLAFVCWRPIEENPWIAEPMNAARPFLPPRQPMDPTAPGPFAFADAGRVRGILEQAGFEAIDIARFDVPIGGGTLEETLELSLRLGPLGLALREQPELASQVAAAVRAALSAYVTADGVLMAAAVWIVHGIRPTR